MKYTTCWDVCLYDEVQIESWHRKIENVKNNSRCEALQARADAAETKQQEVEAKSSELQQELNAQRMLVIQLKDSINRLSAEKEDLDSNVELTWHQLSDKAVWLEQVEPFHQRNESFERLVEKLKKEKAQVRELQHELQQAVVQLNKEADTRKLSSQKLKCAVFFSKSTDPNMKTL